MQKRIAIVGTSDHHTLAPYSDPSWEIWTLNTGPWKVERYDKLFQLHDPAYLKEKYPQHWKWLIDQPGIHPIYMQREYEEVAGSVAFPLQLVLDSCQFKYFTNSISYMIAYALLQQPDEIGIWGVDMALGAITGSDEYAAQRPSCELLIGIAIGQGVKVTLPQQSDLCKTRKLYAYDLSTGDFEKKIASRKEDFDNRRKMIEAEIAAAKKEFSESLQTATANLEKLIQRKDQELAVIAGAIQEQEYINQWEGQ